MSRFYMAVQAVNAMRKEGYDYHEAVSIQAEFFGVDYRSLMNYFQG